MAEEPKRKYVSDTPTPVPVLLKGVLLFSYLFAVSAQSAGSQPPISFSYPSDLSMPLWGGGQLLPETTANSYAMAGELKLHHFDQIPCGSCHNAPVANGSPASADENGWKLGVDVNRSCTSFGCHEYDEKLNHPIGVPLPAGASTGALTGQSPTLTCLSCHQLTESGNSELLNDTTDVYLQSADGLGCQSCHQRFSGSLRRQSHWKFGLRAHLVSLVPGRSAQNTNADSSASEIDAESTVCLSCHDEVKVTIPALNETRMQKALRYQSMTDHPIGMDYRQILALNPMYFNSLAANTPVRLFDGKVGCGSCHSPYSPSPDNLVAQYDGSVLCRTCHNR